ncbi:discoidin domain-containing protein [Coraliomargarita algicola]|uniref:Discoidin domain-containing protein n=1 Tax=Coraliomargarita algicola TaxID=3092156 RepID=A0ABZ0RIH3_9BACT|nr:discoidin domain-containing protein [Coraliomargarita sp. J2-16]WPJ94898.1 discoidin domain-containing protein [Coraliomargarita sp. J2-16]
MNLHYIAVLGLLALLPSHGYSAKLLTDNLEKTGVASYPGSTSQVVSEGRIQTGASAKFLVDATVGQGFGTTDPDLQEFGTQRLFDGYNERVGNTAVYGAWHSSLGATVLIDLKAVYDVAAVSASLRTSGRRGATTFIAQISQDGQSFEPLGVWDRSKAVLDSSEEDAGRNVEVTIQAEAPVSGRYLKVFLSHWDETHSDRLLNQLVIGELAVWGDELSE